MDSIAAVRALRERLTDELVVTSLGTPSYLVNDAGDRPLNFYLWAAMGMASSTGLGLAIARPERRVVIVDGDGAALMNLGGMVTVASWAPKNLLWLILENRVFLETGGQPIAAGRTADLVQLAHGAGIATATRADSPAELGALLDRGLTEPGPTVVVARVSTDSSKAFPIVDPIRLKHRFRDALGLPVR
jgi:phosphonopyruvate decarboxylase